MWLSDILKKLDTLLSVRWGQIQSPPEPGKMQVFCSQQTAWREKKPPFTILEPSASCSLWNGKKQSCSHGTHSDEVSNMFSLGMSWSFTHHCVRELSIGIQAKDFFISSKLQVLQGYYGDRVIWFSQAFRICNHNNNFERPVVNSLPLLAVSVINWKEEAGKKKEKSLIVAELMCFCLLWIVSSSPL